MIPRLLHRNYSAPSPPRLGSIGCEACIGKASATRHRFADTKKPNGSIPNRGSMTCISVSGGLSYRALFQNVVARKYNAQERENLRAHFKKVRDTAGPCCISKWGAA